MRRECVCKFFFTISISCSRCDDECNLNTFIIEFEVRSELKNHKDIASLFDYYVDQHPTSLIMDI